MFLSSRGLFVNTYHSLGKEIINLINDNMDYDNISKLAVKKYIDLENNKEIDIEVKELLEFIIALNNDKENEISRSELIKIANKKRLELSIPNSVERFLCISNLLSEEFEKELDDELNYGDSVTIMSVLCKVLTNNIDSFSYEELNKIFNLVENINVNGEQSDRDYVCTCFLENLQNKNYDFTRVVDMLGPESIAFCKAWDEFTGCKTKGLY